MSPPALWVHSTLGVGYTHKLNAGSMGLLDSENRELKVGDVELSMMVA